jgi:sugar/nucleoside kinase (ribokinase family)
MIKRKPVFPKEYDVVVIADLCVDILFTGDVKPIYGQVEQFINNYELELGGSAAIFASQFSKLGGKVGLLGTAGEDIFGQYIVDRVDRLGITTEYISRTSDFKTAVGLNLSNQEDRAMLTYKGSIDGITSELLKDSLILNNTNHVHIVSYFLLNHLQSFWSSELASLKKGGMKVSLDTNWDPDDCWESVIDILHHVDVFIPNEEEALRISKKANVKAAGKWLSQFGGLVVVKCGENGAIVFEGDSVKNYNVPELLLSDMKISDTTGAGDNFDAGFLYAWLKDKPIDVCVNLGLRCGTSSLSKLGGIAGQITQL